MIEVLTQVIPIPAVLGLGLYVHKKIEDHENNCPVSKRLESMDNKLDILLEAVLGRK